MPGRCASNELEHQGRVLVERLGGRWTGRAGLCCCPAHDDRTPSLSVRIGETSLLFHCFAGCASADVVKAVRAAGHRLPKRASDPAPSQVRGGRDPGARSSAAALRIWAGARPIDGTPAERYLKHRGLDAGSTALRYHPRTPHGPWPLTRFRAALVAAVSDQSGTIAVHRTFLDPQSHGPAGSEARRCGLGRFGRGAVRLGGIAPRLGLAEGIETALSASALFGLPCWATLGTERFRHVAIPPQVSGLVLFLDNDRGGRRAEALARKAFAHLAIEAHYPRQAGEDWNDVLRAEARLQEP